MHIEQILVGEKDYFHQDKNGWKAWCRAQLGQIARDFACDLPEMTRENQRYFGDWVSYHGYGDVGYYLGTAFVQDCLKQHELTELIRLNSGDVCDLWKAYAAKLLASTNH